ncbi:GatB/YqeY domain-containing protein [Candidatus Parcubacteria bacterium]|nr:GatB/YqeY domain-containing protein [Candidatus Parcubacteria bacterium]
MSIHQDIREQIKGAMRAKDAVRLTTLRGLLAGFTNELVAKDKKPDRELTDEEALSVISRQVKQRKDSIEQFEKGGRNDLANNERAELVVLEAFLPAQMSYEEILEFVKAKQTEIGLSDKAKSGQFTGLIMKDLKGRADGMLVKRAVDSLFS